MGELPLKIGHYEILKSLGKGGMGEVFLAKDPLCGRFVAVKKIREDLRKNKIIQGRFLKEAHIAARLTHPGIMPIYTIEAKEDGPLFYTMPYVEGPTLRQIIKTSIQEEKEGEVVHPIGSSIPALVRIFFNVCEAIAYCHSKHVLHRDLKLDNIIVGKYGEVLILDWGLAHVVEEFFQEEGEEDPTKTKLTRPGKIAGTLSYLAPERLFAAPPSYQTDIYSLGVILYQLLTLKTPFHRPSIQIFRKNAKHEKLKSLHEVAPYRNIPPHLADIAKKCLKADPSERYQTVDALLVDLNNYLEGKPEWIETSTFEIDHKEDWQFQENILLSKRLALAGALEAAEWVNLMISKASFSEVIRVTASVTLKETGLGIGFLLGVPVDDKVHFEEGYCLWIGSTKKPVCKLFRSQIEVMDFSHIALVPNQTYTLLIEKFANRLRFYLQGKLICNYITHIPLTGSYLGVLYKDRDFEISPIVVSVGSRNVTVSCLAVPDAFLANKNYAKALVEYRKIRSSFTGRKEAEEAIFRAGITLLEEAKEKRPRERKNLSFLAFEEFSALRDTPGAPLEYLGKALVYQFLQEIDEEMKCLELGLCKYPKHPLIKILHEHILFRLHETASKNRLFSFYYALLTLRYLPHALSSDEGKHLTDALKKTLLPCPFFLKTETYPNTDLAILLALYLAKPLVLIQIFSSQIPASLKVNIALALLFLGYDKWVKNHYDQIEDVDAKTVIKEVVKETPSLESLPSSPIKTAACLYLIDKALKRKDPKTALFLLNTFSEKTPLLDYYKIQSSLLLHRYQEAEKTLASYSLETHPLFLPLKGALIWQKEGKKKALAFFKNHLESSLVQNLSSFLTTGEKIPSSWEKATPFYEKIELFHMLQILYACGKDLKKQKHYIQKIKRERLCVRTENTYT